MSIFWQHVGDANSVRDFPRTIGTPRAGLREFSIKEVEALTGEVGPIQAAELDRNFARVGNSTFQIWGLPTGAKKTLSKMETGDYLMLLNTNADWGAFGYVGRVLYYLPGEHWQLSEHLWRETKFPLIVLLKGTLISYPWPQFLADFGFGAGLKPMGRTYRISDAAFSEGPARTHAEFYDYLVKTFPPSDTT